MQYFGREANQIIKHVVDVMHVQMDMGCSYREEDVTTINKLTDLRGPSLVITGEELDLQESQYLFRRIVRSEIDHWVPDASQRLLSRAALALNLTEAYTGRLIASDPDCGPGESQHVWTMDCVAGVDCARCTWCCRLGPESLLGYDDDDPSACVDGDGNEWPEHRGVDTCIRCDAELV